METINNKQEACRGTIDISGVFMNNKNPIAMEDSVDVHTVLQVNTGTGRSSITKSIIVELSKKYTPETLKILVLDFEDSTLDIFNREPVLPHIIKPVVVGARDCIKMLDNINKGIEEEIDRRCSEGLKEEGEKHTVIVVNGIPSSGEEYKHTVVGAIDSIARKGRKVGVHLILTEDDNLAKYTGEDLLGLFGLKIIVRGYDTGEMRTVMQSLTNGFDSGDIERVSDEEVVNYCKSYK